jgi:DNA mismatch repair protein MutS
MAELTPLMKQYFSIKSRYKDAIVFFRLGDFYEMFGEDAIIASKVLQIALTTRDRDKDDPIPMCGVPYFTAETYISKLIKAGYRVALCEQLEDPSTAKGLVERDVVRVITAGTHIPEEPKENSFILSFYPSRINSTGIAIADIHTGEFILYETDSSIEDEISRFQPKEVLYPLFLKEDIRFKDLLKEFYSTPLEDWNFEYNEALKTLLNYFRVSSLEGFGVEGMESAVSAAGALITYLNTTQKGLLNFKKLKTLRKQDFLYMDASTIKNLELLKSLKDDTVQGSLLWVLDETLTPMGGRLLRNSITRPLLDINEINNRLSIVEALIDSGEVLELLRNSLRRIQDIERLAGRIATSQAGPRELVSLKNSLRQIPQIKKVLSGFESPSIIALNSMIRYPETIVSLIERALIDDPPHSPKDGGFIKDGFDGAIDELRNLQNSSRETIALMEAEERQRTGIQSLKIGYNRVFGYYIEVTKANLRQVPSDYERKQTLVGAERFVTPKLKEYEARLIGAEEELKRLEYEIFQKLLDELKPYCETLKEIAGVIALLDMLTAFAIVARRYNYTRPVVDESSVIEITDGRHPSIERLSEERFVPNNLYINTDTDRLLIITGPNMAGKSTYMRQNALIVIMAQMGSFVPASKARIGLVDRIFTRIGASDFLLRGQSTFMVEMIETANILNNATERSLIILDEVGRGTSTFDGISIAWAVAEYIAKKIKARTLFATHYHELTDLSRTLEGVKNYNVAVKEWGDEIIFLRKIDEGPSDKSYGIQVARLAGLPEEVILRAKEILANLEDTELTSTGMPRFIGPVPEGTLQLDLFGGALHPVIMELKNLDLSRLRPEEALKVLKRLKQKAER